MQSARTGSSFDFIHLESYACRYEHLSFQACLKLKVDLTSFRRAANAVPTSRWRANPQTLGSMTVHVEL